LTREVTVKTGLKVDRGRKANSLKMAIKEENKGYSKDPVMLGNIGGRLKSREWGQFRCWIGPYFKSN